MVYTFYKQHWKQQNLTKNIQNKTKSPKRRTLYANKRSNKAVTSKRSDKRIIKMTVIEKKNVIMFYQSQICMLFGQNN